MSAELDQLIDERVMGHTCQPSWHPQIAAGEVTESCSTCGQDRRAYSTDLNACREAERKIMQDGRWFQYLVELNNVAALEHPYVRGDLAMHSFLVATAPATSRCKAMLKALEAPL